MKCAPSKSAWRILSDAPQQGIVDARWRPKHKKARPSVQKKPNLINWMKLSRLRWATLEHREARQADSCTGGRYPSHDEERLEFAIDRGGSFTDVVVRSPDGGIIAKTLISDSPERYRYAAVAGIRYVPRGVAMRPSTGLKWVRWLPPMPCSSARASQWRHHPRLRRRFASATRRGRIFLHARSSCPSMPFTSNRSVTASLAIGFENK